MKRFLVFVLAMIIASTSFAQGEKTIKRKVAIGRFTNETQYGKGMFYDRDNDPMQKQATDFLMAKLNQSGKFILLERSDIDALVQEKGEGMNKINADYLIVGSITKFGRKTEGQQKVFSSTKTQTVEAGVSIRIVDAATSLVIYSEEAEGFAETTTKETLGLGGEAGFDATLSDKAISAVISQLVENIIKKCTDQPWRSYILAIEDGNYVISGGKSQGLAAGDVVLGDGDLLARRRVDKQIDRLAFPIVLRRHLQPDPHGVLIPAVLPEQRRKIGADLDDHGRLGFRQAVQLPVIFEHAASVYAYDPALPVYDGICRHYVVPVKHHRPVPDNKPFFETPVFLHERVGMLQDLYAVFLELE